MRTLGLLGGMSWESSIEYERLINQGVRERLGGNHSADLIVRSYDFARIEALQEAGDWASAAAVLAADARRLESWGAQAIVVCTNTMHVLAEQIEAELTIPLLHIGDVVAAAVLASGSDTVGLLGTRYTMEHGFFVERLARSGVVALIPDADDRQMVHNVIYSELVRGIIAPESRNTLVEIAHRLVLRGARGIIAGCTELELLIGPADIAVGLFPTTRLHAAAAVEFALTDR